ncbi:DUF3667 domain-containing protein [Gemmatimonadota bacterium]
MRAVQATPTEDRCPNCGSPAGNLYCSTCGQERDLTIPTVRQWVWESAAKIKAISQRSLSTGWRLVTDPGRMTQDWIGGSRSKLIGPIRLYLLTIAIWWVPFEALLQAMGDEIPPGLVGAIVDVFAPNSPPIWLVSTVAWLVRFSMVPLLALMTRLLHGHEGRYGVHVIAALNAHSFLFLAGAVSFLATLPIVLFGMSDLGVGIFLLAPPVLILLHLSGVNRVLFHRGWISAVSRAAVTLVLYGLSFVVLTVLLLEISAIWF